MDAEHELLEFAGSPKTDFAHVDAPLNSEQKDSLPIGRNPQQDHDVHTLARLGKRQVLKVRSRQLTADFILALTTIQQRRFGFMNNAELQLHGFGHMGGRSSVGVLHCEEDCYCCSLSAQSVYRTSQSKGA